MTPVPPTPLVPPMTPPGEMEAAWILLCVVLSALFFAYAFLQWKSEQ